MIDDEHLINPALLAGLSEEERKEALAAAAAAKRAEERAEQRALERAIREREEQRRREREAAATNTTAALSSSAASSLLSTTPSSSNGLERAVFIPKNQRLVAAQNGNESTTSNGPKPEPQRPPTSAPTTNRTGDPSSSASSSTWLTDKERESIKYAYLGKSAVETEESHLEKAKKLRSKKKKKNTFRFEWDDTDDTLDDADPLYAGVAGTISSSHAHARQSSNQNNKKKRPRDDGRGGYRNSDKNNNNITNNRHPYNQRENSVMTKPLASMTTRDWRIFRENFDIVVKGGKAPPPMRSFREAPAPELPNLHPALLDAIENVMKYKDPSPIQRQAIPIGLQRRDLIGIAETGSGKTCAFGVPLCHYILSLPEYVIQRVADQGPLALVVAPTRELALQINGEFTKLLSRQRVVTTCAIVGGQSLQQQAQQLRNGVHIVVGTPGRLNECIEMRYLVLNQCCYIVLDEADRMIDMGFAPQMETILESMGGVLKSENETEAYQQELEDLKNGDLPRHRLTAMFSATMPPEVERMAKQYLRHPAMISIGDQDSGKNARIVQRLIFTTPNQKENALRELIMNPRFFREKIIVFVNEKKHADGVGRMVERFGRQCVVLHGGKSQEQREENLATFRKGGAVLVATDVAGRGLDIPDVAHVINYDLPTRSIDSYTHRIGRTGRAGKEGYATSLITDEDEGIMPALKAYLESTGSPVPERLARHPAANTSVSGGIIH